MLLNSRQSSFYGGVIYPRPKQSAERFPVRLAIWACNTFSGSQTLCGFGPYHFALPSDHAAGTTRSFLVVNDNPQRHAINRRIPALLSHAAEVRRPE
jgi:hypothetical protein